MEKPVLEEKVDRLEEMMMMRLAYTQQKTEMELQQLSREMREFKREMQEFKREMQDFKNEMREFKDEMRAFKDEMRAFKDEMDKKWGWVINKLGTMVVDLIYPSIDEALRKHLSASQTKR